MAQNCFDKASLPIPRNRATLLFLIMAVIGLGLASRKYPFLFPAILGKYPGDVLWSLMIYFLWAFFKPATSPYRLAVFSLITSYLDEFSQLIQTPGLNMIRHTTLGHLVLGTGFSWCDIFAYTIGVGLGIILDLRIASIRCRR